MDKATIVGTYEFLGFHLCNRLLEEGFEVNGIHLPLKEQVLYKEEKNLQIGRNTNYKQYNFSDWLEEENKNGSVLFIDFYDFFMRKLDEQFLMLLKEKNFTDYKKIIMLVPQSMMANKLFQEQKRQFKQWIHTMNGKVKHIYLPTIFGPWQSIDFSFQKRLINKQEEIFIDEREWRGDAINVHDAVENIILSLQLKQTEILFRSETNGWEECARYLSIPYENYKNEDRHFAAYEHIIESTKDMKEIFNNQQQIIDLFIAQ